MATFVLQQGHVPRTRGATGAPGEQAYAHEVVVAEAERILRAQGHTVHVMGADDSHYPAGDVFVAVHYDGSTNPKARGASVGYRNAAGQQVAHRWKHAYQRYGFAGGYRPDNYTTGLARYYGTGRSRCKASFILEGGFGSHPTEGPWLRSREGVVTCARAIADALTGTALPPPEEDDVKQSDIDKIIDGVIERIHTEGLTPRTKDDIALRTWKADTHGKEARNRLHDIDVRTQQIRAALDDHREFDVSEPEDAT